MHRRPLFAVVLCLLTAATSYSQVSQRAATLITRAATESDRITLYGNTHPAVTNARDLGPVEDSRLLKHIYLQLKRPASAQAALDRYLEDLHNPRSSNFHKWGSAAQFSERFGMAPGDIAAVREWLESNGFTVHGVSANLIVDFSGTALAVRNAFHTSIHRLNVNGTQHIANITDPQIPAAFADAVVGPVALHNFKPKPQVRKVKQYTPGNGYYPVVPYDLHTIYNFNPLFQAGVSGKGQTIVLLERTNLYSEGDWYAFRKTFGLSRRFPYGTFRTIHPNGGDAGVCSDPGVNADDTEATLDVEWASAASPNAAIVLASCADTDFNFGPFIALQNLLTGSALPPAIVSLSYGGPESETGTDGNAYVNGLYELAVFQGVSIFVSSGDEGADSTDARQAVATHGINVNALASTPNNVAVGGTDYADGYFDNYAQYWSSTNGPAYNSAKSYVPEIPWSDSCASTLIANFFGYAHSYGADGFCNSALGEEYFLTTSAAGGGPSGCATGESNIFGVVGGTCKGWIKPSFQKNVFGNPGDGVRDLPDVSLMAADGGWGHYYPICYSNPAGGGVPCDLPPASWAGAGGTSFGAPIMAGIQSLANQVAGSRQGNPNYVYYSLASSEYGASGRPACDSTRGAAADPSCIFHDVTLGDMDINCAPLTNSSGVVLGRFSCFYPATNTGANGVLSVSNTSYEPAYPAKPGWDFATGIGTVNTYNLIANWPSAAQSARLK